MTHPVEIRNLKFVSPGERTVYAVNDLSLSLGDGEVLGLLGEFRFRQERHPLRALMRLLPKKRTQISGSIQVLAATCWRSMTRTVGFRGQTVSMIFQSRRSPLDPVYTIGQQISETGDASRKARPRPKRGGARWKCWKWCAFPRPNAGSMPTARNVRRHAAAAP